jgi:predicted LPLAT superfamily acyltransferase
MSPIASDRESAPLLRWPDLRRLGALAVGGAAACVVPRRWDVGLTTAWFELYRVLAAGTIDRIAARMERHLPGPPPGGSHRAAAERHVRARIEDMWGRVRGLRRHGFRPAIEVEGLEHARAALARGRGLLVWGLRVGSATVLKQGFAESGLPLVHLSRAEHGSPTLTRLGIGVVAPLYRRGEDDVLGERVQIPLDGSLGYLRTLGERLAANRCVSIFGEHPGRQSVEVAVLGIRRRFALGAPSLAWRHDAGLVTAYAVREGPFHYRVIVEEEMAVDRDIPRRRFAERAVHQFAGRLERAVLCHPADWQAWFYLDQIERPAAESESS